MILAVGWLGLSYIKIKTENKIVNEELSSLENKIAKLEVDNNYLEKLIGYFSNPSYLEQEARLKLNYMAPGEKVAFVYPDTSAQPVSSSESFGVLKNIDEMPNYIKWIYYLLGYY